VKYLGWIAFGLVGISCASATAAQENTLWYRGFFDGWVTIQSTGACPGYYYRPSRPTAHPLNEVQYSFPLPCETCGRQHAPGALDPATGKACAGKGSHFDPDLVYRPFGYQLQGQYTYEKQNHYTWRSPVGFNVPLKYNQRTEPSGVIPMGRGLW
jgi:hypothetical protein